ncbi:DUF5107 domain-containing protein [Streptomyces sp. 35G-GA-8]|uniref:DUF5107 domain-containing protein n=1 Tax=Streptomyces sp. 35G-GA-8 TaxID=2939434 RepID=UPI00201EDC2D|nr:DUF5107 domain-containing protein [Streptomyces sp. 35G-GA-8]MCL7380531.1 DUF5107 domain-containing protein [Streptomyces sp. 35G-GA-8]
MSELRITDLTMPTADLGPVNPLPPLFSGMDSHVAGIDEADDEMRRNVAYGRVRTVLPYLKQDGYGRQHRPRAHRVAVLENETLRATFLLDAGGRLWSLVHRPSGRELLFRNSAFQPGNLALRDAWVAGGVEWNFGTIGHSTTTASPLHAVRAQRPDGTPVLRMYEYERIRRAVFQIDCYLPDDSEALLVHVSLVNPNDHEVPVYWWSNIAVPETADTRVIAPADQAWHFAYDKRLRRVPVPHYAGRDLTYTTRAAASADYFFELDTERGPWIAALDGAGRGLAQRSTRLLTGRKLFHWGTHRGGNRWQEWLSGPGTHYLEIQAGLARTQLEHLALPARTTWSWTEAYGHVHIDPTAAHSDDWQQARSAAETGVDALITSARIEQELQEAEDWTTGQPAELLHSGSGWGALERNRRAKSGDDSLNLPATPFPDTGLGPEQEPWLALLNGGQLPQWAPTSPPASYEVSPEWEPLLEQADGWLSRLCLGVLRAARGDLDGAADAWTRSVEDTPNAWAWRNLGALAAHRERLPAAVDAYARANDLAPDQLPLTHELVGILLRAGRADLALERIDSCSADQRADGRLRMLEARAALETGDTTRCGRILDDGLDVPNLREGDTSLSDLWHAWRRATAESGPIPDPSRTLPHRYDFVMRPESS